MVAIPAHFSLAQERQWVAKMLAKLETKGYAPGPPGGAGVPGAAGNGTGKKRRGGSDAELMARAAALSDRYLDGRAVPATVRWVTNQNSRWGSATPAERTIRLSDKLRGMPGWVVDYVLLHELSHLLVASHGPTFWALLHGYPQLERAKSFLDGVAYATSRGMQAGDADGPVWPDGAEMDTDEASMSETNARAADARETGADRAEPVSIS